MFAQPDKDMLRPLASTPHSCTPPPNILVPPRHIDMKPRKLLHGTYLSEQTRITPLLGAAPPLYERHNPPSVTRGKIRACSRREVQ
eukprot:152279-Hanusia_phi.AAC.1